MEKVFSDQVQLLVEEMKHARSSEDVVDVNEELIKIVIASVAGHRFAFHGASVKEILPCKELFWIPGVPDYISGLINVRGDIESLISLCTLFGYDCVDTRGSMILLVASDGFRSGIMVDTVDDVLDLPVSCLSDRIDCLEGAVGEYMSGEIQFDNEIFPVVSVEKLAAKLIA